jgi:hypothetical protein
MKSSLLLILLSVTLTATSCKFFRSDEEKRKETIIESLKYINEGDEEKFKSLFAENNFAKDPVEFSRHFNLAKEVLKKYGVPAAENISFKPLEGGVAALGAKGVVKVFHDPASTETIKGANLEYVFLNDNPDLEKFLDFKVVVVE